jgi:hypothetical protein
MDDDTPKQHIQGKPASVSDMTSIMGRLIGLTTSLEIIHKKGDAHKTCYPFVPYYLSLVYYKETILKLSPRYKLRRILIICKLIIGLLISRFLSDCIFVKKKSYWFGKLYDLICVRMKNSRNP